MLLFLTGLAYGGACNCGIEFYLARLTGDVVAADPNADHPCPVSGSWQEALSCAYMPPWTEQSSKDRKRRTNLLLDQVGRGSKAEDDQVAAILFDARAFVADDQRMRNRMRSAMDRVGRTAQWDLFAAGDTRDGKAKILYLACEGNWEITEFGYVRDFGLDVIAPPSDWKSVDKTRAAISCDRMQNFVLQIVANNKDSVLPEGALRGLPDDLLDRVEQTILARAGAPAADFSVRLAVDLGARDATAGFDPSKLTSADKANLARIREERKNR